jgi:putative hydrolase of the HAD superfamily
MNFRAVLFDAAETLFTTRGTVGEIYGSAARKYGSTASPEVIQEAFLRHFRGAGPLSEDDQKRWWKDIVRRVFTDVGMFENFDRFFDEVYEKFRSSQGWTLFPETLEVLEELKRLRLKLGVISNFDSRIYPVMDSLGIRSFFDAIVLSSETGYCKPDPEIFAAAASALGFRPPEILLVGDNPEDDVEAGLRAGFPAVLIDRRGRYASRAEHLQRIASLREVVPKVTP